jgi:hypothetical protein
MEGSETVWKPATAKNGSDAQLRDPQNSLFTGISRRTAINGGDLGAHGKEGVSGSSPEEGFEKRLHSRNFGPFRVAYSGAQGNAKGTLGIISPYELMTSTSTLALSPARAPTQRGVGMDTFLGKSPANWAKTDRPEVPNLRK